MQQVYLPGVPMVARSETPARYLRQLRSTSRSVRPMVALARAPGPKRLLVALMPRRCAIGPFTRMTMVGPESAEATWCSPNSGAASAFTAAATTGMYSGLQPAITALIATFSAVTATLREGIAAITASGSRATASSISATSAREAGTTGSPSVQPRA
ncbi:hypothetical protein D3C83_08150 [compost metagenome]